MKRGGGGARKVEGFHPNLRSADDFPEVDVHPGVAVHQVTIVSLSIFQLHQLSGEKPSIQQNGRKNRFVFVKNAHPITRVDQKKSVISTHQIETGAKTKCTSEFPHHGMALCRL